MVDIRKNIEQIIQWRLDGLTYQVIADKLNCSRQRVDQLIKNQLGANYKKELARLIDQQRKRERTFERECSNCGKKFKTRQHKRLFCSRQCYYVLRNKDYLVLKDMQTESKQRKKRQNFKIYDSKRTELVILSEAARLTGISANNLRYHCAQGNILGVLKRGDIWFIPKIAICKYLK